MSKTCLHFYFAIILTLFVVHLNANSHYILIQLINDLNFNEVERPAEDYTGYKSAVLPAAKPAAKYYRSAGPGWVKPAAKPVVKPKKPMKGIYSSPSTYAIIVFPKNIA